MQASQPWVAPTGTLGKIIEETAPRVDRLRADAGRLAKAAGDRRVPPSLAQALRRPDVGVIAEIKRKSPSRGWINARLGAAEQASAYAAGGAAAISVLTEPVHFEGSPEDLEAVASATAIPLLKKDFHVDPSQLLEARALGASAVLLIVRALPPDLLKRLVTDADRLCLDAVVEVRDERELEAALSAGASIIGVNNRNLETLEVEPRTVDLVLPHVPAHILAIAESGVATRDDVERVAAAGADAVLVGSALSGAVNPRAAVAAMVGVRRVARSRRA